MRTIELKRAFEELSPIQKQVAEWGDGPLLVLAGPGSGKTRVLTCRIASLLEYSIGSNFRILGLTFTNKAADEMRNRVALLVPGQEDRLFLGTFHSFCSDVLRQHGTHLGINPSFQIYSQNNDLQAVLDEAVEKSKKSSSIVSNLDKKTLLVIQRLKSLLISPENCREIFSDKQFGERIAIIYPAYENELNKRNALDFNSLIFKTYQLFTKFPAFAKRYRTVYQYICLDEFQDTDQAQYGLITALTENIHRNLFIVADDDQIIYQWKGASHERLKEFVTNFSPKVIQLPMNYRCPPEIVNLANNLIQHNFLRTTDKKPLEAFRPTLSENTVRLLNCFPNFEAEANGIAEDIKKFHFEHLSKIVILGRNRKLLDTVYNALNKNNLIAFISQRKDEFESTPFIWLHSILHLATDIHNLHYLEAVNGSFLQLTLIEVDLEKVISQAQALNIGFLQSWLTLVSQKNIGNGVKSIINEILNCLIKSRDFEKFSRFALTWFDSLTKTKQSDEDNAYVEAFARFDEEKLVWNELLRDIKLSLGEQITLEAFLQELQMRSKESTPKPNTIILMTIHAAKGKEFDHVYLIGLVEDELPSFQSIKNGDRSLEMEEERRNCFVAITRTIETLTLSYAEKYRNWPKKPSRFLYEMGLLSK